jgi:pyruvate kinase
MLDSMQQSARPTRAEASDVANAVIDGTDACMLSAETAIGKYPRQAVQTMNHIAYVTESRLSAVVATQAATERMEGLHPVTEAVVEGASLMARRLDARLIVVASHSGATALALSKQRNFVPTLGISDSKSTLRQMCLYWGVTPLEGISEENVERTITHVQRWGREQNLLSPGQRLVLVSGTHTRVSGHNQVLVHEVADPGR